MTMDSGFTYVTREKVVDLGDIPITMEYQHSINSEPYIGIGVMIVGAGLFMLGKKRSITN
jgi:hypothetical protein